MTLFFVFGYDQYYPGGGVNDCHLVTFNYAEALQEFDRIAEAREPDGEPWDHVHLYTLEGTEWEKLLAFVRVRERW